MTKCKSTRNNQALHVKDTPKDDALPSRNAAHTRERILSAARVRFSRQSYENVGTRDIAADAGVDAALVNRYFGSKEKLFAQAIEGGFHIEEHLPDNMSNLGIHLVAQVLDNADDSESFDALRVLLRATGSPAVAAMVSERFHAEFVRPLAKLLGGRDSELRAALIASYVLGLATMRHGLESPSLAGPARRKAATIVAEAIQSCVGKKGE